MGLCQIVSGSKESVWMTHVVTERDGGRDLPPSLHRSIPLSLHASILPFIPLSLHPSIHTFFPPQPLCGEGIDSLMNRPLIHSEISSRCWSFLTHRRSNGVPVQDQARIRAGSGLKSAPLCTGFSYYELKLSWNRLSLSHKKKCRQFHIYHQMGLSGSPLNLHA